MMISPQTYADGIKDKSYEELIEEREKLIREIKHFEKHRKELMNNEKKMIFPSPDVEYQMNLEYLGSLCVLLSDKFNEKFEH